MNPTGNIGNLNVFLGGDTSGLEKSIATVKILMRQLSTYVAGAGKSFKKFNADTLAGMTRWNEIYKGLPGQINKSLKPIEESLAAQNKGLIAGTKNSKNMALGLVFQSQKTDIATKAIKAHEKQLKTLSSSLWLVTAGLKQFGMAMTIGFTAPIVAAAALATKSFMDIQKGTISIQRAAEISSKESNKITEGFIKISQEVPITVGELQKAGYAAAQAGITGEKAITNFAKAAVMLGKVGGDAFKDLSIENISDSLAKLSIAFNESGKNMEKVSNTASMLLAVSKAVPGGLGEVIEALKRAAPMAATLGLSLADLTAMMGTLVAAAVPAARAGTEINTMLSNMVKNSDKVAQALGITTEGMRAFKKRMDTDLMGVLVEVLQRYRAVGSNINKVTHLQQIFGEVAIKSILPLINNLPLLEDLQARANHELENGTLLARDFAIQANSLSGTFIVFTNNVRALTYAIGKDLAPYVSYFLRTFSLGLINLVKG